ncbi:M48 family metalloprotease [Roseicella aerolata]|uniref:M48 family metalloprotease n=1 Tax=Roseicella aerolata TaxID=2883479 RepID=A0A9X1ID12_9PROT|nr:M48 family metalloprotease [Roseicella aerolata]MCB4820805.1 M48 family metalloprotease [Roseicella aerolata]
MRKAWALISALVVMLASLVPSLAPVAARAQGVGPVITVRDAETESFLRSIAHPLFRAAGVDPALVRITLVQARPINAFVTTGNRMFINTGLIQQSESVAELAGVLAHETGHIAGGHIARLPEEMRNAFLKSIAGLLLGGAAAIGGGGNVGGNAAGAIMMGSQAMAMGQLYAFTRSQEQAADQAGVAYLDRLGWSSRGMVRLLTRLQEQELLAVGRQDPYFRTHPLSRDRLEFVTDHVARSRASDAPFPPALETGYRMVRAKLDAFIDAPMTTWRRYPEGDASPAARYVRAIAQYRSGRADLALDILAPLVRDQPGNPWLRELQGQILFEAGRPREALAPLREAARLAPSESLIRTALGRALMESGDPSLLRAAAGEFEASLRLDRENAFTWRQLGIAHGRLGQMPQADLALAEEAMLRGDFPAVRLLARRAEEALPPGPLRLRAQDLREAVKRENMTSEQRAQDDAMRRRQPR